MDNNLQEISLGKYNQSSLEALLKKHSGDPIALSSIFMGAPYHAFTLDKNDQQEKLVVNFGGVDCFTFLDYTESLKNAKTYNDFLTNLQNLRYQKGKVGYQTRNHFFSDWVVFNGFKDVTKEIGQKSAVTVKKILNKKDTENLWLKNLNLIEREITYIPNSQVTETLSANIKTGDYLGIYTPVEGLDVTHVGMAVWQDQKLYIRHASKKQKKVIDELLMTYLKYKPGLLIYRK